MSSLTEKDIAIKIRRRMNATVSDRLRYHPLINDGSLTLAREVASDPTRRHLMLTNRVAGIYDGATGICDLTALIATPRILLDKLPNGDIFHPSSSEPMIWQSGSIVGNIGNYDNIYAHCWLEGTNLYTRGITDSDPTHHQLEFSVSYWATLALLQEQLVEPLVEHCVRLLIENYRSYQGEDDDE